MKIVVDIPDPLVGRIKEVVESDVYENSQEFVATAIENQLELEGSDLDEIVTLDEAVAEFGTNGSERLRELDEMETDGLGKRTYDTVPTVTPPDEVRLTPGPLWGQYNKIFPAKLVVRRLANVVRDLNEDDTSTPQDGIQWMDFEQFQEETGQLARNYGLQIREQDEKQARGRGEKLSAGLPTGEDAEKSISRFQAHFVGQTKRDGSISGATPSLLFVNVSDEEVRRIGITDAGLAFAELYNPLLDKGLDAEESLSMDEREFYIDHVRDDLPAEYKAMMTTANAIADGENRPVELTDQVRKLEDDWSDSKAKTMRSGIVSRMHELGLIERERVGQRGIAYTLTESGEALVSNPDAGVTDR